MCDFEHLPDGTECLQNIFRPPLMRMSPRGPQIHFFTILSVPQMIADVSRSALVNRPESVPGTRSAVAGILCVCLKGYHVKPSVRSNRGHHSVE